LCVCATIPHRGAVYGHHRDRPSHPASLPTSRIPATPSASSTPAVPSTSSTPRLPESSKSSTPSISATEPRQNMSPPTSSSSSSALRATAASCDSRDGIHSSHGPAWSSARRHGLGEPPRHLCTAPPCRDSNTTTARSPPPALPRLCPTPPASMSKIDQQREQRITGKSATRARRKQ